MVNIPSNWPKCQKEMITKVTYKSGSLTWILVRCCFLHLANAVSDLIILCTVIKISLAGLCYGLSFWTCVKMCAILVLSVMLISGFIRECECT